jgi:prolyl-tRNA editing enzyme YbaK/EbsC (Cys-tRNA(Pro) deacylase)
MDLHPAAQRFQARLREVGIDAPVRELGDSTRTAAEAAAAVGVDVGQIVKSLVFVDESLLRFPLEWCAAGTGHPVFPVPPDALIAAIPRAEVRQVS